MEGYNDTGQKVGSNSGKFGTQLHMVKPAKHPKVTRAHTVFLTPLTGPSRGTKYGWIRDERHRHDETYYIENGHWSS